jgi:hypothetical protein
MNSGPDERRRAKINAEAIVEITDEAALIEKALANLEVAELTDRAEQATWRDEIKDDAVAAVRWLADSFGLLPDVPGAHVVAAEDTVVEVDQAGLPRAADPDFVALFAICQCGKDSCDTCSGYQLTSRTAAALWTVAQILADFAYDDVTEFGDEAVNDEDWALFNRYPPVTHRQDAVWRRQAARVYDDLTDDIATGREPHPTCPGDEMALHLMLRDAAGAVEDGWAPLDELLAQLPEHPDDFEWDAASQVLFQDYDILGLFDVELDGVEDTESGLNRKIGMGDYRPPAWFRTFINMDPRDGRRRFRR